MSNLIIRLATAAVMIPLLLVLLFYGPAWGWLLSLLAAGLVAASEFFAMTHPNDNVARAVGGLLTWAIMLAIWFSEEHPALLLTVVVLLPFAAVLLTLWRLGDVPSAGLRVAAAVFGPLWVGVGFGCIALVRVKGGDAGAAYVVFTLGMGWLCDTGGYFAGRAFGKHKLYEKVSPNKTVEGAIGGVAVTIAGAVAIRFIILPSMPLRDAIIVGAVGSLMGMMGDLGESLLKRAIGVKDTGGIVPGHGGLLDRVDAVLITAPLMLLYLVWVVG